MADVHAVTDHEKVRTDEAHVIDTERLREPAGLLEKDGDRDFARAAFQHQLPGEGDGAAGLEDVIDEQDVAPCHIALHVADKLHLARRGRAGAIARQ